MFRFRSPRLGFTQPFGLYDWPCTDGGGNVLRSGREDSRTGGRCRGFGGKAIRSRVGASFETAPSGLPGRAAGLARPSDPSGLSVEKCDCIGVGPGLAAPTGALSGETGVRRSGCRGRGFVMRCRARSRSSWGCGCALGARQGSAKGRRHGAAWWIAACRW